MLKTLYKTFELGFLRSSEIPEKFRLRSLVVTDLLLYTLQVATASGPVCPTLLSADVLSRHSLTLLQ